MKCKAMKIAAAFCAAGVLVTAGSCQKSGPRTLKVGDTWGATHPMAAALDNVFKTEVEKNSKGTLKVEVYHDSQLGNEADLWDGVRMGTVEVAVVGTPMNQEFTMMMISDWPFLYRDLEHAKKVWTGDIAGEVNIKFHEAFPDVSILGWGPNSARTFTSNKPLTKPDDFKGQKFRMPGNPIHIGIVENLGASAQTIPLGELYNALSTGTVDGQDNGMVTVKSQQFYKVQKYLYETNHIIATLEILINQAVFDGLKAEEQQIVRDAGAKAAAQAWDDYIASIDSDREFLVSEGMTVTPCSPADQAVIISRIQPLVDSLYTKYDWSKALTDEIRAVE